MNRKRNNWEDEEFLRTPQRKEKDKLSKHRKAIYDMIDEDEDDGYDQWDNEYFTDNYSQTDTDIDEV